MNEERSQSAGIYLFADADSLKAYLEGLIVAATKSKLAFSDIDMKVFDVIEEATLVTRGSI